MVLSVFNCVTGTREICLNGFVCAHPRDM